MEAFQCHGDNILPPDLEGIIFEWLQVSESENNESLGSRKDSLTSENEFISKYLLIDSNNNYELDLSTHEEPNNLGNIPNLPIVSHQLDSNPSSVESLSITGMTDPSSDEQVQQNIIYFDSNVSSVGSVSPKGNETASDLMKKLTNVEGPSGFLTLQKDEENNTELYLDQSSVASMSASEMTSRQFNNVASPSNYTAHEDSNLSPAAFILRNGMTDLVDSPICSTCEKSDPHGDIDLKRECRREARKRKNNEASKLQRAKKKKKKEDLEADEVEAKKTKIELNAKIKILESQKQKYFMLLQSQLVRNLMKCTTEDLMNEYVETIMKKTIDCEKKLKSWKGIAEDLTNLLGECLRKLFSPDYEDELVCRLTPKVKEIFRQSRFRKR